MGEKDEKSNPEPERTYADWEAEIEQAKKDIKSDDPMKQERARAAFLSEPPGGWG